MYSVRCFTEIELTLAVDDSLMTTDMPDEIREYHLAELMQKELDRVGAKVTKPASVNYFVKGVIRRDGRATP